MGNASNAQLHLNEDLYVNKSFQNTHGQIEKITPNCTSNSMAHCQTGSYPPNLGLANSLRVTLTAAEYRE